MAFQPSRRSVTKAIREPSPSSGTIPPRLPIWWLEESYPRTVERQIAATDHVASCRLRFQQQTPSFYAMAKSRLDRKRSDEPSVHCVAPEARRVPHEVEQWPCNHDHFGRKLFSSTTALASAQSARASAAAKCWRAARANSICGRPSTTVQRGRRYSTIRGQFDRDIAIAPAHPDVCGCGNWRTEQPAELSRSPCACEGAVLLTVWRSR